MASSMSIKLLWRIFPNHYCSLKQIYLRILKYCLLWLGIILRIQIPYSACWGWLIWRCRYILHSLRQVCIVFDRYRRDRLSIQDCRYGRRRMRYSLGSLWTPKTELGIVDQCILFFLEGLSRNLRQAVLLGSLDLLPCSDRHYSKEVFSFIYNIWRQRSQKSTSNLSTFLNRTITYIKSCLLNDNTDTLFVFWKQLTFASQISSNKKVRYSEIKTFIHAQIAHTALVY